MGTKPICCLGLQGPARAWWVAENLSDDRSALIVCPDFSRAEQFADELRFFVGVDRARLFPSWQLLPFERVSPERELMASRLGLLLGAAHGHSTIWVASVEVVAQLVHPSERLLPLYRQLSVGDYLDRDDFQTFVTRAGYRTTSLVESVGDYATRGLVIDIFSPSERYPVRLYVENDRIVNVRLFDPQTQRTVSDVPKIELLPVSEWIAPFHTQIDTELILSRIRERGGELHLPSKVVREFEEIVRGDLSFPGMEFLQSLFYQDMVPITDYLGPNTPILFDDRLGCEQSLDMFWEKLEERTRFLMSERVLHPRPVHQYLSPEELRRRFRGAFFADLNGIAVRGADDIERKVFRTEKNTELETALKSSAGSGNALHPLKKAIQGWQRKKFRIVFVVGSIARAERLSSILATVKVAALVDPRPLRDFLRDEVGPVVAIMEGTISEGVQMPDERLIIIGEHEIFHDRSVRRRKMKAISHRRIMHSLRELQVDDFIVHRDYGIGIYRGLQQRSVEGHVEDFLAIEYADSRLFVPIQLIGKVQRFLGADGHRPKLDRLGSKRWFRARQKAREATISLAGDLLRLYATRSVQRGWHFDFVGAEDERFADGFPYDETPDQSEAIRDTLTDMSSDKAMDRLICGDVGFGKTEVAIRAAFKAFQHAKQTAVLVPTTILVEQHRRSFEERFMGYPAVIGAVSRFYSDAENRKTVEDLAAGKIDIIIGTHRLLEPDIHFQDLGLLVIDEEQRFGVRQKERLRQVASGVDTLTMTATPIPRTLHLAMIGARDVSVLRTPPVDRRPIRTCVAHDDSGVVRDAIDRELNRGGQVFFLHNRVETLSNRAKLLQDLFPKARVFHAHGQMQEAILERVMQKFLEGQIDILVTTTIIESGLDVPNANTIIVDNAHLYGLAQLYQIRGRVGRGARQAYAYFLVPQRGKLPPQARERLQVLQSFEGLGGGFILAMRDLELRGAGNLLGKEQSGKIDAVGFEMFTDLLREAVAQLKGDPESGQETVDPEVKIPLDACIPEPYIPDVSERLLMYQRLAMIEESKEADDILAELSDRFGYPSDEVCHLVEIMRYRGLCRRFAIAKAEVVGSRLALWLTQRSPLDLTALLTLAESNPRTYRLGRNLTLWVQLSSENLPMSVLYKTTESLLEGIRQKSVAVGSIEGKATKVKSVTDNRRS